MRRTSIVLVLLAALWSGGCVTVNSPFLGQLGVQLGGESVVITNVGGGFCNLVAGGNVNRIPLDPGQVAYDTRRYVPQYWAQVPVLAVCYTDHERTEFLGATGRIFNFTGQFSTVQTWDIWVPGAEMAPAAKPASQRVKLPREWWNGASVAQAVNASRDAEGTLLLDGRPIAPRPLLPGEVVAVTDRLLGGSGRERVFTMLFTRQSRLVGKEEWRFLVPWTGVYAAQFLAGRNY